MPWDKVECMFAAAISTFVLIMLGAITAAIISSTETKAIYAAECSKIGGKAVWNGQRWECLPTNTLFFNYGDD